MLAFILISFVFTPLIMWIICFDHLRPGTIDDRLEFFFNTIKHPGFWVWAAISFILTLFAYIACFQKDWWL